jgi:Putative peptidoglycan binding domain/L,D-transpeptidase catalytic domain
MNTSAFDRRVVVQGTVAAGALGAIGCATAGRAEATSMGAQSVPSLAYPELRKGSSGAAVRDLQTKLAGAGYWLGSADGSFGHLTQQAVYAIQKYYGLSRDGVCGPNTWAKVNLRARPRARSLSYTHIEVDKPRQLVFAVSGGVTQLCLNTSTGSNKPFEAWGRWYDGRTPSGTFRCYKYIPGWYTNALGGLYRPVFFNGGIALHGSTSIPPYNASHGCCRLSTSAQSKLIDSGRLRIGTTVVVY